jgi:tetratricopeptide (TPR) repeat protein
MLRYFYLIFHLPFFFFLCLTLPQLPVLAQGNPVCLIIQASGQMIDLSFICKKNEERKLNYITEAQYLYNLAIKLARTGQFNEAVNYLTQSININPNNIEAYIVRGHFRIRQKDSQGAREDFQRAADIARSEGQLDAATMFSQQANELKNSP